MRETKTITTPGGHKVVLYTYLSGRDRTSLQSIMYGAMKADPSNMEELPDGSKRPKLEKVSGEFLVEQEKQLIKMMIVSLDDTAENAFDRLLDLPETEYNAVKEEVEKVTNPTTPQNSEQPGSGTSEAA